MEDGDTYNTGDWLNNWWNNNGELMANSGGGIAGAFGQCATGIPDWTCHGGGSDSNCDLQLHDNRVHDPRDGDDKSVVALREALSFLTMIIGIGALFAGLGPAVVYALAGAGNAIASGAIGAGRAALPAQHPDVMVVQSTVTTIPGLYRLTVTLAFDLTYDLLVLLF
ncbi:hypothetical protein E8E15_011341 [Penicillium rubens]|nr:hypothetical protein E8E15_011341 [Penicillium rubens]